MPENRFAAGALLQTPLTKLPTFPEPLVAAGDEIKPLPILHSIDRYLTSNVPTRKYFSGSHDASANDSNSSSLTLHKTRQYFVKNCDENTDEQALQCSHTAVHMHNISQ